MGLIGRFTQSFSKLGCAIQLLIGVIFGAAGIGVLLLLISVMGINLFSPPAQPSATPTASATIAPTASPAAQTAAPTAQPTATTGGEDTRLVPPEDFALVGTTDGTHTVSWVWPDGTELDPTFFRVSVSGQAHDFDFTGPGDYEVEVPALCLNNPNFLTLDAFNTDVEPEANSQAEELIQADPGC
jgi:hypothetical protein